MVISRKANNDWTNKSSDIGTTFYRTTLEEVKKSLKSGDANIWVQKSIEEDGFDAIDFKHNLYGSRAEGDVLYICITDGYDIKVNGKDVDPETALDYYDPDTELAEYIMPATDDIIQENITKYEIYYPEFDDWAIDLLKSGSSFIDLARASVDFDVDLY